MFTLTPPDKRISQTFGRHHVFTWDSQIVDDGSSTMVHDQIWHPAEQGHDQMTSANEIIRAASFNAPGVSL